MLDLVIHNHHTLLLLKYIHLFSNIGFAASNISACGVEDAPTTIVFSSFLPDEQPVNKPTANVDTNNTFANFLVSFLLLLFSLNFIYFY